MRSFFTEELRRTSEHRWLIIVAVRLFGSFVDVEGFCLMGIPMARYGAIGKHGHACGAPSVDLSACHFTRICEA